MKFKESYIKKYGSLENYYKQRNEKLRKTALNRCQTEEERQKKLKEFEWADYLKSRYDPSKIGQNCICEECGDIFKANATQQIYCNKCKLRLGRIRKYGSLENYYRISEEHQRKTKLERYGSETYNNRKKAEQTCLNKYGVTVASKDKKIKEKSLSTKKQRYGEHFEKIIEKTKKTNLERYGVTCTFSDENIYQKTLNTKKAKYGEHLEKICEKSEQIKLQKYGNKYYTNREKAEQTLIDKFGTIHYYEFVQYKAKKTNLERYGVENYTQTEYLRQLNRERLLADNPMSHKEIKEKMINTFLKKGGFSQQNIYFYNSLYFDSSWELYYFIYLKDLNIDFKYKPTKIEYFLKDGSSHFYIPDFYTDHFIEIKGDHLYDFKNHVLLDWHRNPLYEKTECLKLNNVEILHYKQLIPVFEYVNSKYGKDYIKSFKKVKNENRKD